MAKIDRSNYSADLRQIYNEKVVELKDLCKMFDEGKRHYAKFMATNVHMMCSNEGNENSILKQLEIRDRMRFYSHIVPFNSRHKPIMITGTQLLGIKIETGEQGSIGKLEFTLPPKTYDKNKLTFKNWWKQWIVLRHKDAFDFNNFNVENTDKLLKRSEVIYYVRSQEGGSHFDEQIEAKFKRLKTQFINLHPIKNGVRFGIGEGDGSNNEMFAEYPLYLVRSITQELLDSLKDINIESFKNWK
jgi:hypothetical protein